MTTRQILIQKYRNASSVIRITDLENTERWMFATFITMTSDMVYKSARWSESCTTIRTHMKFLSIILLTFDSKIVLLSPDPKLISIYHQHYPSLAYGPFHLYMYNHPILKNKYDNVWKCNETFFIVSKMLFYSLQEGIFKQSKG